MKKILLLFVVSLLMVGCSFAQVKISGGVIGGLNLASASIDPAPTGVDLGNLTGFGFGGVLNFAFDGFAVQVEPMYLQSGVKYSAGNLEAKDKVSFINIPVLLIYTFTTSPGQVEPYVLAGPTVGFTLSAKYTDPNGVETDFKSTTSSTNFGVTFGAGVKIPVGMNRVFVEGRYELGLKNLNTDPNSSNTTVKSKGIGIFAGITFPFGS